MGSKPCDHDWFLHVHTINGVDHHEMVCSECGLIDDDRELAQEVTEAMKPEGES